jgi:chromosome segregation ATPase
MDNIISGLHEYIEREFNESLKIKEQINQLKSDLEHRISILENNLSDVNKIKNELENNINNIKEIISNVNVNNEIVKNNSNQDHNSGTTYRDRAIPPFNERVSEKLSRLDTQKVETHIDRQDVINECKSEKIPLTCDMID